MSSSATIVEVARIGAIKLIQAVHNILTSMAMDDIE